MIHIIWKGKGWMVFVITFFCSLLAELITRAITHDDNFYSVNPYPLTISLIISGAIIFFISKTFDAKNYDLNLTEAENIKKNTTVKHSLFFIPIRYWSFILLSLSLLNLLYHSKN